MLMKQEKHAQGLTQLAAGQVVLAQHNGGGVPKTFARAQQVGCHAQQRPAAAAAETTHVAAFGRWGSGSA